jgi:hypothetical protein
MLSNKEKDSKPKSKSPYSKEERIKMKTNIFQ